MPTKGKQASPGVGKIGRLSSGKTDVNVPAGVPHFKNNSDKVAGEKGRGRA
jgi:hypothetical protein